jgi:hypothetical protein
MALAVVVVVVAAAVAAAVVVMVATSLQKVSNIWSWPLGLLFEHNGYTIPN